MATYLHPGVYVEEIPSGSKPIEGVATSVAAFIGYTTKGPLGEPVRITKWDAYKDLYGGVRDTGKSSKGDPMGHSVLAFFQNGGTTTYIVRITRNWMDDKKRREAGETKDAVKARGFMDHPSAANTQKALKFTAVNEGVWANGLVATFVRDKDAEPNAPLVPPYTLVIGDKNDDGDVEPIETFSNVSLESDDPQYIENVVNGFSELVEAQLVAVGDVPQSELTPPQAGMFLGTSKSGVIDPATFADPGLDLGSATPEQRTLSIALDGPTAMGFELEAKIYPTLQDVAAEIQDVVGAVQDGFAAAVVEGLLVLTSGTRLPTSAVAVGDTDLALTLRLGGDRGTETTGAAAAAAATGAVWTSPTAPALNEATLTGGADGSQPVVADYDGVFTKFVKYRDINIILVPGQSWTKADHTVVDAAIAHSEAMKSRVVIVDPPSGNELTNPKAVMDLELPTSTYSVLYYPWVKVTNPFYNAETNPGPPTSVLVPPSGFAAGMWSKIDARRGVWKAPAGVETGLLGVAGLEYVVENGEQDVLNPLGVNALRALPGFGSVIWGSRTLSTKADPEWRYVPVRRTAIMIEQSIYNGIQWAVFEPNDHRLWSALRTNIDGFMNGLFRSGAFQGEKASDAYFVRCRLGDTMTQDDIDAGRVIVIVGFAPLKPAEFVIVRIQQKVGQQ
jgi:hypothetical protein